MIRHLSINNLMLIDKIEMDFGIGLCVLTGETGAGKSMILESLELLSGRRVKTNIRSDNGQKTVITALVEISKYTLIKKVLGELDMNVQDAVNAPRFHHQWLPDVVIFEEGLLNDEKDSILSSKNYFTIQLPIEEDTGGMSARSSIGAVDAIFIDDNGKVSTGADYRGDDYGEILK